jgi:hypothetical protein
MPRRGFCGSKGLAGRSGAAPDAVLEIRMGASFRFSNRLLQCSSQQDRGGPHFRGALVVGATPGCRAGQPPACLGQLLQRRAVRLRGAARRCHHNHLVHCFGHEPRLRLEPAASDAARSDDRLVELIARALFGSDCWRWMPARLRPPQRPGSATSNGRLGCAISIQRSFAHSHWHAAEASQRAYVVAHGKLSAQPGRAAPGAACRRRVTRTSGL